MVFSLFFVLSLAKFIIAPGMGRSNVIVRTPEGDTRTPTGRFWNCRTTFKDPNGIAVQTMVPFETETPAS
jgi:hypothetical protein